MKNTRAIMRKTGLSALLCVCLTAGTVYGAPLPTGLEAAGVATAMAGDGNVATSAGVAISFNSENIVLEQPETEPVPEHAAVAAYEARQNAVDDYYKNIAISRVDNYVNIRKEPSVEAEVVGKIYNDAAAHILDTVENYDGVWYQIQSGSVEGYILAGYFVTGEEAEALAHEVGTVYATIKTDTLRLREAPALDSSTVSLLSAEEQYQVSSDMGDFVELEIDTDLSGYVYRDYVDISVEFEEAISIEEERAELERLAELERQRQEAEEALRREQEEASNSNSGSHSGSSSSGNSGGSSSSGSSSGNSGGSSSSGSSSGSSGGSSSSGSSLGSAVASFAESFAGNLNYVYGGNSLTSGVDCSGFVQQCFAQYGIDLPRTSDDQGYSGYAVSSSEMRPGDIVYYGGHVAIYIGDGCVVHASNEKTGVKISSWNYRTPISIRRVTG